MQNPDLAASWHMPCTCTCFVVAAACVMQAETERDTQDQERGTYLPASVQGSMRHLRDCISNSLTAVRVLGDPLAFITITVDVKEWPEIWTRLPLFTNGKAQA